MRFLCWLFGHRERVAQKRIQRGWRVWTYCARCHLRVGAVSEYGEPYVRASDREAEEVYVRGRDLAIRRGRAS